MVKKWLQRTGKDRQRQAEAGRDRDRILVYLYLSRDANTLLSGTTKNDFVSGHRLNVMFSAPFFDKTRFPIAAIISFFQVQPTGSLGETSNRGIANE